MTAIAGVPSGTSSGGAGRRTILILTLVCLLAFVLTLIRYLTPLSGITGAGGALLAMFGELALAAAGLVIARGHGALRTTFMLLAWLGGILTLAAELFLHGWWSAALIGVGVLVLAFVSFVQWK